VSGIFKKYINFITRKHLLVYAVLVVATLVVGIFVYFQQGISTQSALAEQIFEREEVAVKAANVLLDTFVGNLSNQISAYSTNSDIISFDPQGTPEDLGILLKSWKDSPASEVLLVDANGFVKFGLDRQGNTVTGTNLSDREYFNWAKTAKEGDSFVGDPIISRIGTTKGEYIVPVASPVIKNGKFNGVLVASFSLDEATTKFLNPLKISDNALIYLTDQNGTILSASIPSLVGVNYLDYVRSIPGGSNTAQTLSTTLTSATAGKLGASLPDETKNQAPAEYLIVYSPIFFGSSHWVFSIATPKDVALSYAKPFYKDQLMSLIYLIVVVLFFAIAGITSYRIGSRSKNG
jgi:flagellar basal body-associated protein FliL